MFILFLLLVMDVCTLKEINTSYSVSSEMLAGLFSLYLSLSLFFFFLMDLKCLT